MLQRNLLVHKYILTSTDVQIIPIFGII